MNIELLDRLKAASGAFVPIADLGPDPGQIQADLDGLQAFGFGLERHPFAGVAYRSPADRLCPDQIEHNLGTRLIGRRIAVWNRVGSTNDLAAAAASSLANEGLVVIAEEQTSGRGSRGRTWTAPPGSSILMSVLLFPRRDLEDPGWLTALAAVSVAEAVMMGDDERGSDRLWSVSEGAFRSRIKWPNDVRIDGRKVAGILLERGQGTVMGIGLNVNIDPGEFPTDLRTPATSLQAHFGRRLDRSASVRNLIRRLDFHYDHGIASGRDSLVDQYCKLSEHHRHRVEVVVGESRHVGRLEVIDFREGLTLRLDDGRSIVIPSDEIVSITTLPGSTRRTRPEPDEFPHGPDPDREYRGD